MPALSALRSGLFTCRNGGRQLNTILGASFRVLKGASLDFPYESMTGCFELTEEERVPEICSRPD